MASSHKPIQFTGLLFTGHKSCAVEVPFDPSVQWQMPRMNLRKGRNGHRVKGELNAIPFEGEIVPRMGRFWLQLSEEVIERADVSEGAEVRITITSLP